MAAARLTAGGDGEGDGEPQARPVMPLETPRMPPVSL